VAPFLQKLRLNWDKS